MKQRIQEIQSFLEHNDHSLAVRRMLDMCLDSGDTALLQQAIDWSRYYHHSVKDNILGLPEKFYSDGYVLLQQLEQAVAGKALPAAYTLVEVKEMGKTYKGSHFSLSPISLAIQTGDIIGVVGENGNGKTTLLRCLGGQLALDTGSIDYPALSNPDYYAIKHKVAFIPQRIPRWFGLLKDNLHFSASLSGITGERNQLMVAFMLERLGLQDYAHLNWNQISSGYRTRFEIARVLLQQPSLLILDEPLANLDINAQQTVLTDLRYMAKSGSHPMGILLSSQQLHEVEKVADHVILIKKGKAFFNTGNVEQVKSYALEIETLATRENLLALLNDEKVQVQYNGGFYTIVSETHTVKEMISLLINGNITITYFRDITHSTKRYF